MVGLRSAGRGEVTFRITAWATSGVTNVGEPHLGRLPPCGRVTLSGLFGESLRTNYHHSTAFRSKEQASRLPDGLKLGGAGILNRDVAAQYRAEAHQLLFCDAMETDSPQDIVDTFFLRHRLRRWLGGVLEINSENRAFPLYSITGMRLAFAIGVENRHAEWIHHRLMQAGCAELLDVPFTSGDWPPGAGGPLVTPAMHCDPIPPAPPRLTPRTRGHVRPRATRTAASEYRARDRDTDVEIMRRLFRHDPTNPAFELIDARAASRALDEFERLSEGERMQLYGALTAVIWLGGHEVPLPHELSAT